MEILKYINQISCTNNSILPTCTLTNKPIELNNHQVRANINTMHKDTLYNRISYNLRSVLDNNIESTVITLMRTLGDGKYPISKISLLKRIICILTGENPNNILLKNNTDEFILEKRISYAIYTLQSTNRFTDVFIITSPLVANMITQYKWFTALEYNSDNSSIKELGSINLPIKNKISVIVDFNQSNDKILVGLKSDEYSGVHYAKLKTDEYVSHRSNECENSTIIITEKSAIFSLNKPNKYILIPIKINSDPLWKKLLARFYSLIYSKLYLIPTF